MFKDYYKILGILPSATDDEIKKAYREMSITWHPDKNINEDVTEVMQDINEAYAILKDTIKKQRYDKEYMHFCVTFQYNNKHTEKQNNEMNSHYKWSYDYSVQDDELKEDIKSAQRYAKDLVAEFFKELREMSKKAAKGAATNAINYAVSWVVSGIFLVIIGSIIKTCS